MIIFKCDACGSAIGDGHFKLTLVSNERALSNAPQDDLIGIDLCSRCASAVRDVVYDADAGDTKPVNQRALPRTVRRPW